MRSFEPSVKGEPHPCHMPVVVFEADILRARLASANAHTRVRARRSTYSPVGHLLNQTETEHFEKTTAETNKTAPRSRATRRRRIARMPPRKRTKTAAAEPRALGTSISLADLGDSPRLFPACDVVMRWPAIERWREDGARANANASASSSLRDAAGDVAVDVMTSATRAFAGNLRAQATARSTIARLLDEARANAARDDEDEDEDPTDEEGESKSRRAYLAQCPLWTSRGGYTELGTRVMRDLREDVARGKTETETETETETAAPTTPVADAPTPDAVNFWFRRVLLPHWSPYDRVGVVNADP